MSQYLFKILHVQFVFCTVSVLQAAELGNPYQTTKGPCPADEGWSMSDGYCYFVSSTTVNWRDARDNCHQLAAELVSIHTQQEQDFINSALEFLPDAVPYVWTGLTEQDSGIWEWTDGTNVTYFNWAESEGSETTEQCMAIVHLQEITGLWYDHHCESSFLWMCKKHPDSDGVITTPVPTPSQGYCPPFYLQYRDRCYNLGAELLTWDETQDRCSSLHPDNVVSIRDSKEQAFLSSLLFNLDTPMWIGAKQHHEGEFWWSDNSPLSYTNWYPGQPNGTAGTQYCAYMHSDPHNVGFWEDEVCSQSYEYMCMTHVDSSNKEPPPADPHNCTSNYTTWNNDCYKFLQFDQPVSWDFAENECNKDNGYLTSIMSRYEQAYIFSSLPSEDKCVWIGLYSQDQFDSYMFLWSDERATVYTQWAVGEPSILKGSACVCIGAQSGDWYTKPCSDAAITEAICKISDDTNKNTPVPSPQAKCPTNNWILFGDYCYLITTTAVNQTEARGECRTFSGGELVSIHSIEENFLLTAFIQAHGSAWIGLMKDEKGGFYWSDGSAEEIFIWDDQEPSDKNGTDVEMCTGLNSVTGKWFDSKCESSLGYICKTKAELVSSSNEFVGLAYGWQILIILSTVLLLAMLVAIVMKYYKQPTYISSSSTSNNEQCTAQPYSQDDPEHAGYDQPRPENEHQTNFYDITLHHSTA